MNRIIEFKKYKDIYNIKEWEVKMSIAIVVVLFISILICDGYELYDSSLSVFQDLILYTIGGLFGLLSFSLTSIAIITSLFSSEKYHKINEVNGPRTVDSFFASYEFLALVIGLQMILLIIIYFFGSSNLSIVNEIIFYFVFCFLFYVMSFIIFYLIALIFNLVSMFKNLTMYDEILHIETNTRIKCNEVKIDYLLKKILIDNEVIQVEDMINEIVEFAKLSGDEAIINQIRDYYSDNNYK
ncbi:hypothetical protein [Fusibacter ferrireducens]|uniref:Uncharacterized protein n=1 Tax=Fusibacter ferrireducens TaxID=2785058 RepID=A0ABR9ZTE5_9FIRM|nr:hypothetical protein [Fusibacter ferrireducens]MBF4693621.1 hypothetical protein [Fusibacter ferrireducens]